MPKKKSISYEEAIRLFSDRQREAFDAGDYGSKPGQCGWYTRNFISYVSELGYHIELEGDEILPVGVSEVRT